MDRLAIFFHVVQIVGLVVCRCADEIWDVFGPGGRSRAIVNNWFDGGDVIISER